MTRMHLSMLALAGALLAPAIAHAQGTDDGLTTARCVAESAVRDSRRLLDTLPGSAAERAAMRELAAVYAACGTSTGGRSALAQATVERRIARGGAGVATGGAAEPWYASAIAGRTVGIDYDGTAIAMQQIGTCIVRAGPDASTKLLGSAAGSAEERAAIAALKPLIGPCVPEGTPVRLNAAALRLMLAEPLYHMIGA